MAERYSVNYNKTYVTSNGVVDQGEGGGKLKFMYDSYTLPGEVLGLNDTILLQKAPAGARLVDAFISCASLGTTGKLSLGWEATLDEDGDTLSADADGIIDEADAGGAAVTETMQGNANLAGLGLKFGAETQIYATCTEVSTNTTVKIRFGLVYVVD